MEVSKSMYFGKFIVEAEIKSDVNTEDFEYYMKRNEYSYFRNERTKFKVDIVLSNSIPVLKYGEIIRVVIFNKNDIKDG